MADGTTLEATSFGAPVAATGEVVFNTGMVGYPEALTDPSYRGQILVLTYPLIGNYGVPDESVVDKHGLPEHFESKEIHISGLVVSSYSWEHSHWNAQKSLAAWLKERNIPAVFGVDTRELTKTLREHGSICGRLEVVSAILFPSSSKPFV
jgi:carbamoyl-phosphate synthase small subunit